MAKKYIVRLTEEERAELRQVIKKLKGSSQKVRRAQIAIAVTGGRATARIPDFTILSEDLELELKETNRSTILSDMAPPTLVVEVVSPN